MHDLATEWMKSYATWEPGNQLVLSCACLLAGFVLVILGGIWILHVWQALWEGLGVCCRGYPPEAARAKPVAAAAPAAAPGRVVSYLPPPSAEPRPADMRLLLSKLVVIESAVGRLFHGAFDDEADVVARGRLGLPAAAAERNGHPVAAATDGGGGSG